MAKRLCATAHVSDGSQGESMRRLTSSATIRHSYTPRPGAKLETLSSSWLTSPLGFGLYITAIARLVLCKPEIHRSLSLTGPSDLLE